MKCRRCGKHFVPREDDQEYGPTCARIVANRRASADIHRTGGEVVIV